jgi:hypothetical protein
MGFSIRCRSFLIVCLSFSLTLACRLQNVKSNALESVGALTENLSHSLLPAHAARAGLFLLALTR